MPCQPISIIIPTLNESRYISRLLDHLMAERDESVVDIIVVDGGSTDETTELVRKVPQVTLLECERPGRAHQMNRGAAQARGDIFYFVHADTLPPKGFVEDIRAAVADDYPIGCFRFRFDSEMWLLKINSFFTRFDRMWCRGGDQSLFITRELFEALDGYCDDHVAMEEYELIDRARRTEDFRIIPKEVLVSARKYEQNGYLKVQWANFIAFRQYRQGVPVSEIYQQYRETLDHNYSRKPVNGN